MGTGLVENLLHWRGGEERESGRERKRKEKECESEEVCPISVSLRCHKHVTMDYTTTHVGTKGGETPGIQPHVQSILHSLEPTNSYPCM